jgi:hypothetical protein
VVKLAEDEVTGIHALSKSSDNQKANVVMKIPFPDGGKHRLPTRKGCYVKVKLLPPVRTIMKWR